jgi:thioester reductase-like protein
MGSRRILVSGISGAIGVELAAELAHRGNHVIGLLHRNHDLVRNNGERLSVGALPIETIQADITKPRLGLSTSDYDRLQASVDLIVHSAAITEFGRPRDLYELVNVQGTQNMLALAERTQQGAIPFLHVSTAYVCGDRSGVIHEDELDAGGGFANSYEESKFHAEALVRSAVDKGLPATVGRPSIVVGSSENGTTRDFTNVYVLLKTLVEGRISVIPGNYDAVLDLVPIDYVVSVLLDMAERMSEVIGRTLHLVGDTPITLRDCSDVLAEYPPFLVPRVVPPPSFDKTRLTAIERGYHDKVVSLFAPYLTRRVVFSAREARAFSGGRHQPQCRVLLRRLLDYCLQRRYLGTPLTPVSAVLDGLAATG